MQPQPSRILIYGVTGSGKTTLAPRIAGRLGLPWHSVDDLTWEKGWIEVPPEIQRERIAAICAQPTWVLDSAYSSWLDLPMASADLIVGLDYPRYVSLRLLLARDSILWWHFHSFPRKRERMRQWQAELTKPQVLLFRSPAAVEQWLNGLN